MNHIDRIGKSILLAVFVLGGLSACIDEEEDKPPGVFSCVYEGRKTSCSSSAFGPWTAACSTVDFELREGLSPEQYCQQAYPANDVHCAGSCCLSFQYRNVSMQGGACGGQGSLALLASGSINGGNQLRIEARWSEGDVDLAVFSPLRDLLDSQNPQAEDCVFSGDDRYVLSGLVESVECRGTYLVGDYHIILSNHSATESQVSLSVDINGGVIQRQQLRLAPNETQAISVVVH